MIDIKSHMQGVADREKWVARRTSFVAKVKATKLVWFPPEPAETGKKTATAAKKTTKRAAKKTTAAAKKPTAAAKTASGTKKVTTPVRRKKT